MPQRAALQTGGGDGTVVVVVVVVVVAAALGGACCVLTGGDACSLVPQAARTAGTAKLAKANRRRVRTIVMTLLIRRGRRYSFSIHTSTLQPTPANQPPSPDIQPSNSAARIADDIVRGVRSILKSK
jgi:hypothetical protein